MADSLPTDGRQTLTPVSSSKSQLKTSPEKKIVTFVPDLQQLFFLHFYFTFCFQKDHENVEAPFYYLAKEFHSLYNEKIEQMKTLT